MAALPPLPGPLGILGGYAPAVVRGTASTRSAMFTGVIPLAADPRRSPGMAILFTGRTAPPPTATLTTSYDAPATYTQSGPPPSSPSSRAAKHPAKPGPVGTAGDERSPSSPSGPPGRGVVAGSATASGGGAAPVLWCAILIGLLAYTALEFRRHRFRLVLLGPVGFVSPQQRPG
jgi:hypothetical protein